MVADFSVSHNYISNSLHTLVYSNFPYLQGIFPSLTLYTIFEDARVSEDLDSLVVWSRILSEKIRD